MWLKIDALDGQLFVRYTHQVHFLCHGVPRAIWCLHGNVFINDMLPTRSSALAHVYLYNGMLCSVHAVELAEVWSVVFGDDGVVQRSGAGSGVQLTGLRHQVSAT